MKATITAVAASIFRDQMTVRRLRVGAGLIMLCYLTLHFCMHALGNVSFEAMQWGTQIHDFVWHSVPGTIALYGAFATHFTLALYAIYSRRSFRMGAGELVRFFSASLFYRSCFTTLLPIGTYIQPLTSRAATTLYSPPTFPSFRSGGGGKSRCSWWLGRMGASACITGYERDPIIINSPPYCSPSRHSCQCSLCSEFGRAHAKCWHNGNCIRNGFR